MKKERKEGKKKKRFFYHRLKKYEIEDIVSRKVKGHRNKNTAWFHL